MRLINRDYEYKYDRMQSEINLLKREVTELEDQLARRESEGIFTVILAFFIGAAIAAATLSVWCTNAIA
jgi:hypothetical protein